MLGERNGLGLQEGGDVRGEARWEAADKGLIGFIDESVLIPQGIGIGNTHANVVVRLEDLLSRGQHS